MPQSFKLGNGIVDRGWDSPPLESVLVFFSSLACFNMSSTNTS